MSEIRTATIKHRRGEGWNVRPEVEAWDGRRVRVRFLWHIEDDDRPMYAGEDAWEVLDEGFEPFWIATGDLVFDA